MTKLFTSLLLLAISVQCYAQRFAHYNTGTLYDSFENPSQAAFNADSSRRFAFNLLPNFNANLYLKGNAQYSLKSRAFLGKYDNSSITIGEGKFNDAMVNLNVYVGMLRMFTSMRGKRELGLSYQIKGTGRGHVTDETIALFNGTGKFDKTRPYFNIFNNRAFYEAYHQFSLNYLEHVTHNFTVGIKLSALSGIGYNNLDIVQSELNKADDNSALYKLRGTFQSTYVLGQFQKRDLLPLFKNPGAAISLGATFVPNGYIIQGNIKDIGAIRWKGGATTHRFNASRTIDPNTAGQTEKEVQDAFTGIIESGSVPGPFTKAIVGRAEISVAKKYWIEEGVSYQPTAIISKQINGQGTAWALINQVNLDNFSTSLSGIVNEDKLFDLGLQFMYKTHNFDVFIGSEQLTRSFNLYRASKENEAAVNKNMSHSGANLYFGFSFKFGNLLDRSNDSYYFGGSEQGPLGRAWGRLTN